MSKDIRSYFTAKNATSSLKIAPLKKEKLSHKRKPVTVIDSDSDDESVSSSNKRSKLSNGVVKSPTDSSKNLLPKHDKYSKSEKKKRSLVVIDSDSDEDVFSTSTKRNKLSNVVEQKSSTLKKKGQDTVSSKYFRGESVSANNVFSAKPIRRDNSRNIFKVTVKKEVAEFDIDKDFESELLRLDEVVEKELHSQNVCVSKRNSLEAGVEAECGETAQTSSLETEEKIDNNGSKSAQGSKSSERESNFEEKSPESPKKNNKTETDTFYTYSRKDSVSKRSRSERQVKSPKESPVKGSMEKKTPSKISVTSPLKDFVSKKLGDILKASQSQLKLPKESPVKSLLVKGSIEVEIPLKIPVTSPLKDSVSKKLGDILKESTSRSQVKSPKESPVQDSLVKGSMRKRTPSKVSGTSPLKDLVDRRTRRTPSKISVTSPANSKLDSLLTSERVKKSVKTPLFTNKAEKLQNVIEPLEEKKLYSDTKTSLDSSSNLWVDKYKPITTKQIIGQQGDKSCVNKLITWLKSWYRNQSGNKKLAKPSPWAKNDDGGYFKAALLSGPPGVGKTTTAHLVTKELGFDVVEFNASDTRSKKLLHQEVSELLSTNSLSPFVTGKGEHVTKNHVLVMDEVDGMAGNEDRGGVQELIQLIKQSRVPIICMCNDRNHPKIRSLANYCFDLRFSKPRAEQIKGAMMSMCFKEKLKLAPNVITDIITSANQDIRLIINHLSMLAVENSKLANSTKHIKMGPWDITRKIFSEEEHKSMSIYDKCDLFFHDYSVTPLFVQENYLNAVPHKPEAKNKIKKMELFAAAAKSLSLGDLTEKSIRSHNAWGLLPVQAIFSSLVPGEVLEGHIGAQINFPGWFGKNSRTTKMSRLLQELTVHSRLKISGNKEAMNLDYVVPLESSIVSPLLKEGADGIPQALEVLSEYCLVREDLESLGELTSWPSTQNRFSQVESKVKAAFTRAYNKTSAPTPYAAVPIKKGSKAEVDFTDSIPDEGEEGVSQIPEDDEEDEEEVDTMIVVKKKQPAKKADKEAAPSTSKGSKNSKRGRKK